MGGLLLSEQNPVISFLAAVLPCTGLTLTSCSSQTPLVLLHASLPTMCLFGKSLENSVFSTGQPGRLVLSLFSRRLSLSLGWRLDTSANWVVYGDIHERSVEYKSTLPAISTPKVSARTLGTAQTETSKIGAMENIRGKNKFCLEKKKN